MPPRVRVTVGRKHNLLKPSFVSFLVSFRQACAIAIEDTAATQAADLAGISGNQLRAAIGGGAAGVSRKSISW